MRDLLRRHAEDFPCSAAIPPPGMKPPPSAISVTAERAGPALRSAWRAHSRRKTMGIHVPDILERLQQASDTRIHFPLRQHFAAQFRQGVRLSAFSNEAAMEGSSTITVTVPAPQMNKQKEALRSQDDQKTAQPEALLHGDPESENEAGSIESRRPQHLLRRTLSILGADAAEFYVVRGRLWYRLARYERAAADFQMALRLNWRHEQAAVWLRAAEVARTR